MRAIQRSRSKRDIVIEIVVIRPTARRAAATLVPATAAVAIGDAVFTDGRDQPDGWPMVYGTVVQARLPDEAPHWEIRVRPAVDLNELKQVEVLTRRFNRKPAQSPGVLAQ